MEQFIIKHGEEIIILEAIVINRCGCSIPMVV